MNRTYKIIDFEKRKVIEKLYVENWNAQEIAEHLSLSPATIYRELQRGNTGKLDKNGRSGYSAIKAQENAERLRKNRGKRRSTGTDDDSDNKHAFVNRDL